uniref:Uncharacterized protein n=1 Tax=Cynoglossus semilaevis TaxID=244447 RepID=A0A3P8W4A3_CYNSE
ISETVDCMDVITPNGYSIHWMAGSYSGPWAEAKKCDGRKLVPWVDTIKESDIIYKKIALTSNHKLSNKIVQTLRSLYAAGEGGASYYYILEGLLMFCLCISSEDRIQEVLKE